MLGEQELQTVEVKSPPHTEIVETHVRSEHDTRVLARMGKKSVLEVCAMPSRQWTQVGTDICQRRFGWVSILGFTCTILVTWEGALM